VPETHALRVLTGANLPEGTDTVILQEDVVVENCEISFHGPLRRGSNARKAGEDVTSGQTLFPTGHRLTAADLGLLAATGVGQVALHKPLRVAVLSTGDELAEAGDSARADQIYDANRPMLLAAIKSLGHTPVDMGRVPDQRDILAETLSAAASKADVILTSGGASAGDEDHMSALLNETGTMSLWRIAIKPGRPLALGMWDNTPVFGLPGNPVAAMICTLVFARPAMRRMAGQSWDVPKGLMLPAAFSKSKKAGRREYLRARLCDGQVEVFPSEGSGRISGLSWADGLIELSDEAQDISEGTLVRYISYSEFGL
jgi:molybdopterin molybdotransferase